MNRLDKWLLFLIWIFVIGLMIAERILHHFAHPYMFFMEFVIGLAGTIVYRKIAIYNNKLEESRKPAT